MRAINYILFVFLLLLGSCVDSTLGDVAGDVVKTDGEEITYKFSISLPEHEVVSTRSGEDITCLQLLVFDENGRFLARTSAIIEGSQVLDGVVVRNFSATLLSSESKRIIHFISNYDSWDDFPKTHEILNADEGSIVPLMNSASTAYWGRFEFDNLQESSFNRRFPLLRNSAKIELVNEASNFDVSEFAVYHAPALGTVAPFKYNETDNSFTFTETALTEVSPVGLVPPQFVGVGSSINLFEKSNQKATEKVFIVLKGKLKSASSDSFFKLDVMKDQNSGTLHDIVRNRIYRFTIQSVASTATGYATPEEAAINPASNNLMGSVELEEYPSISDGVGYLKVAKLAEVFIKPGMFETEIDYFRDLTKIETFPGAVEVDLVSTPDAYINGVSYNNTTGKLQVVVNSVPTDREINHKIRVRTKSVEDNGLLRYITLKLRSPYDFNLNLVSSSSKRQGDNVTISFDVPGTIPINVFPIPIFFETKELYPNPDYDDLTLDFPSKGYRYEYKIKESDRGRRVTLHFKRTYSNKTETIPVVCQYILSGTTVTLN